MIEYKGYVDKDYFSRYSKDRAISDGENVYYEYDSKLDFKNLSYVNHTITSKDKNKLMIIAQAYYDNPLYWWIIAQANDLIDPFKTPEIGETIRVPIRDDVVTLFNSVVR